MLEALRQVPLFANTPEPQLQWVLEHSTEVHLATGEILIREGDPADYLYILLTGELRITKKIAGHDVLINTYRPGTFFGELPILLGTPYVASSQALTVSHLLRLEKDSFWQMVTKCSEISQAILHKMAERVQDLQSVSQQHEKLIALGTLAAGLAHELNNPAAVVSRDARQLDDIFQSLSSLTLKLSQQGITRSHEALIDLQRQAIKSTTFLQPLNPLTQSDLEDELTDWLAAHNVSDGWKLAPTLVGAGIDIEYLDKLLDLPANSLSDVLIWLETTLTGKRLLDEISNCSTRISKLVTAIKEYSYMDQAPLQQVNLHEGIENTLTILSHKLKQGNIVVLREYGDLPCIYAYGSELNQVWTNLIDNAIDAMGAEGKIWIRTLPENDYVLVEVIDNGSGIPAEIQPRIFEPFFTTKGVGEGTGLGLDACYRIIVRQHQGDIQVFSQPGHTRFQVRLPLNLPDTSNRLLAEVGERLRGKG